MRFPKRGLTFVAVMSLVTSLLLPTATAQTGTTYEIVVGADFSGGFGDGPPVKGGFSLRTYPQSVTIHQNDVLHFFGFGVPNLLGAGEHPEEFSEKNRAYRGDPFYDVVADPDDGENEYKFSDAPATPTADCTQEAQPCEWDGQGNVLIPGFIEEGWIKITAPAPAVIYGLFADDSYTRIEVVADDATASTQAELDARAAVLMERDYDTLAAISKNLSTKKSSHVTAQGKKVWDAWAGIDHGPLGLDQMYPKKLSIKPGDTVRWHFSLNFNVHSVSMPQDFVFGIYDTYNPETGSEYGEKCDPDGDSGSAPDTPATFPEDGPPTCPEGSTHESDLNPAEYTPVGNGTYTGGNDVEHSGVRLGEFLQAPDFLRDESPFDVKFSKVSPDKGFKYLCLVHGPFMSGRVIVKK